MFLLLLYLFIALFFSFLCSIAEAVLLSVSWVHIAALKNKGTRSGDLLYALKKDISKPLTAILTLNTVAHTVGAAGVGAQASAVFGSSSLAVVSAVLTLLILIFSEIIPKTLGAAYWKLLAPTTAYFLKFLVLALLPFINVLNIITRRINTSTTHIGFSRRDFSTMAELSANEGHIDQEESTILQRLLLLRDIKIKDAMTPRTVIFSDSQDLLVGEFFHKHKGNRFSRIPIYDQEQDNIIGFVLHIDILLAYTRGNEGNPLRSYLRNMPTLLDFMSLSQAMKEMLRQRHHIALVVNEHGTLLGILTLEDVLETLIGSEIVDEGDKEANMKLLAKRLWKVRAKKYGVKIGNQNTD